VKTISYRDEWKEDKTMATKPAETNHEAPGEDSSTELPAPQAVVAHASEEMMKHHALFRGTHTKDSRDSQSIMRGYSCLWKRWLKVPPLQVLNFQGLIGRGEPI
jgi:hypothetical protein